MQYIKKQNEQPDQWDEWFGAGGADRIFDYEIASRAWLYVRYARKYLIKEQHGLCAYCQSLIRTDNSSIEHLVAQSHNKELSTNYHNLVAVCRDEKLNKKDQHCDLPRGNYPLPLLVFIKELDFEGPDRADIINFRKSDFKPNRWFKASAHGNLSAGLSLKSEERVMVEYVIRVLNLESDFLIKERKASRDAIWNAAPVNDRDKSTFFKQEFVTIYNDKSRKYRQ